MSPGWGNLSIEDQPIWEYEGGEIVAMARCKNAVIFTRKPSEATSFGQATSLAALDIRNGKNLWRWSPALPSTPVSWGLAVDHLGRIIVTFKDGQVVCFGENNDEIERYTC
jgi:outer membrane protein assembly factor BamB